MGTNEGRGFGAAAAEDPTMDGPCPRATWLHNKQAAAFAPARGIMHELGRLFGPAVQDMTVGDFADAIYSRSCDKGTLPCGRGGCIGVALALRILKDADRRLCDRYTGRQGGADSTRLAFQPSLAEILERMLMVGEARDTAWPVPQIVAFGGYDTVIAPIAAA